ncbi:unnamed protein product [Linum tenue]|uniref:Uncharacterized protein n=1 Tax=Linum tenue TaxID=586396 RepID=A0AAV0GX32_9ROSI|nr:unnamed protein product [Linum tenue]
MSMNFKRLGRTSIYTTNDIISSKDRWIQPTCTTNPTIGQGMFGTITRYIQFFTICPSFILLMCLV